MRTSSIIQHYQNKILTFPNPYIYYPDTTRERTKTVHLQDQSPCQTHSNLHTSLPKFMQIKRKSGPSKRDPGLTQTLPKRYIHYQVITQKEIEIQYAHYAFKTIHYAKQYRTLRYTFLDNSRLSLRLGDNFSTLSYTFLHFPSQDHAFTRQDYTFRIQTKRRNPTMTIRYET
jgi:hypothetical protein